MDDVQAHDGHATSDTATSWGGYETCDDCGVVLTVDNGHEVIWSRGRDNVTDLRYLLRRDDVR